MSLRVYACPIIGTGIQGDPYRSKMSLYSTKYATIFPSNVDGTPASTWVLTIARLDDWSAVEADATMINIFGVDLPDTLQSRDDLRTWLRGRTIGDIPTARRNAIQTRLDNLGVYRGDFTLATPLWKVFQRVFASTLEKDANFSAGWNVSA